ncbi:MAG: exo-alpha-sialidase, partial [Saprospiraceae bacterium]|nr:exo-alpha-sialidase [Saprospiraceae bacterium]
WTLVQTGICWDVQFHPTNPSILYLLRSNSTLKRTEFFKSTDGGQNWDLKDIGWYVPADPANAQEFGAKIAVTAAAPERVYAGLIGDSKPDDNGWIGVYRSDDVGETWSNPSGQDGGPYPNNYNPAAYNDGYHQGFYNFDLEVSDLDPDLIWVGTIRLNESSDGG